MKRLLPVLFVSLFAIVALHSNAAAQAKKQASQVNKIFKNKKLVNGTPLIPDSSINKATFLKQYTGNKALWDRAFDYLAKTDFDNTAPGRYAIAGDSVYAIVIQGPTKTPEQAKWESHLKYIDFQCVLKDAETMQTAPMSTATISNPYDAKTDNINYNATTDASYTVKPGQILLFFPGQVHRAGLKTDGYDTDKRVVVKIMVSN
ncbi:YhcH/YjgK/YiaL family protein [Mucilaginibacter polytrichastri]|uniref:YhcH/YjgK/YiaL family protein n=1 Tax=Mucilaginibacter polytrichastri TaxID=1302689 RepID=UPI0008EB7C7E|nr:YhcH/YjgK/YiaL family protein [Mucilaginibacter polytrichastri]SFS88199.1 YhcH/YjgK/YiaL family protein [Mucilaginibacter polytrichastri]